MATHFLSRSLLSKPLFCTKTLLNSLLSRTFSSSSAAAPPPAVLRPSFFRSLSAAVNLSSGRAVLAASSSRAFATRSASSSLHDQNPNWSNRPPKETILLDGCDFEHWLVVVEKPEGDPTRDEIIDSYIKTLAMVVGSEEEARMKVYSVSTRCYYAFGALVSEEVSHKIKELPRVRWVLPDSYLDVKNKDYGGEPFINGQAVPYDPKYHEEWERNNARAMERNRRNDRPRNNDRSRNFNRRRENMQYQDFQTQPPPMPNPGMSNPVPNMSGPPPGSMGPSNPGGFRQGNAPNPGFNNPGMQQNIPGPGAPPPPNNYNMPRNNMGMQQPSNVGPPPSNVGWSNNMPGNMQQNFQNGPNNGGVPPYQGAPQNYQNGPNNGGVPPYQGAPQNYQNGPNNGGVPPYQGAPQNYQNGYNPNRDGSGPSGYPYSG